MNIQEHLLTCLAEEASEIAQHTCKALRFGIDDRDPTIKDAPPEREQIRREINDLLACVEMLQGEGMLPKVVIYRGDVEAKKMKIRRFMGYAQEKKALQR